MRLITLICLLFSFSALPAEECICTPQQVSKAFTLTAKKGAPAVVFIRVEGVEAEGELSPGFSPNPFDSFSEDFFNRFFGMQPRGKGKESSPQLSQGSGFLVSSDGYIMTNAHVVKGASKIMVTLSDGKDMEATLIGADSHTDIAIIKIEGKDLPFLSFGNSDAMDVGEWVIAIGSPFQLQASVTAGIISAKGRQDLRINDLEDFIQTDAAINPGNSGGPLLNLEGEVIGMNTAIVSRSGGYMGIGFAIPSNMAKNVMTQLLDKGIVTRGFLGVSLQPIDKEIAAAFNLSKTEGVLAAEVVKDSPADKAGLKQGDVILEYNGTAIKSLGSFRNDVSLSKPGSVLQLKVSRKGEILNLAVTLGNAAEDAKSASGISSRLGIEVTSVTPDIAKQLGLSGTEEGVVITKVKPGSPAAYAGMRPGFLVMAVNHKKVANINEFNEALVETESTKRVLLLVRYGQMTRFYSLRID